MLELVHNSFSFQVTWWEKVPSAMCAQRRLKSSCAAARCLFGSLLSAWRNFASLAIQNAPSEDSDQTARMCRLIWIFAGRTCPKVRFLTFCDPYVTSYTTLKYASFRCRYLLLNDLTCGQKKKKTKKIGKFACVVRSLVHVSIQIKLILNNSN